MSHCQIVRESHTFDSTADWRIQRWRAVLHFGFFSIIARLTFLSLGGYLQASSVAHHLLSMFSQSAFTPPLCPAQTNCSFCVLLYVGDTVASNCCTNVIFSLKEQPKIVFVPFKLLWFWFYYFQQNINLALIEAYSAALNHVSCCYIVNAALFLGVWCKFSFVSRTVSAVVMPYVGQFFSINRLALWWVISFCVGTAVLLFIVQQRLELRCIKAWRCHFPNSPQCYSYFPKLELNPTFDAGPNCFLTCSHHAPVKPHLSECTSLNWLKFGFSASIYWSRGCFFSFFSVPDKDSLVFLS